MTSNPDATYRNARVLVTGGLGFIGSNLAIRLVRAGARVRIVDSLDPACGGNPRNIRPVESEVQVHIGDLRDPALIGEAVRGHAYVFHLAGHVSHVQSMTDPATDLGLNAHATLALLEAVRRGAPESRIVFSSTRQVYGRAEALPVAETLDPHPVDVNGVNKLAAERYHSLYHSVYGLRTVSLRLVNTFGPRQLIRHARQGFLGWFVRLAVEGRDIPVFGEGTQLRDINYVDDVVEALLLAGANDVSDGQVFNLGGSAPVSLEQVASILIGVSGKGTYHHTPFPPASRPIDIGSFYCDYSKFTALTGWKPRVPLEVGFARTLAFYREHWDDYR